MIFKVPLSGGGLVLPLSFPQALSTESRVHWRGGPAPSARTGFRWSPGPMDSFFRRPGFDPWVGMSPWRRTCNPLQYACLEDPHGQRSLAGYSPRGGKESDTTESLYDDDDDDDDDERV